MLKRHLLLKHLYNKTCPKLLPGTISIFRWIGLITVYLKKYSKTETLSYISLVAITSLELNLINRAAAKSHKNTPTKTKQLRDPATLKDCLWFMTKLPFRNPLTKASAQRLVICCKENKTTTLEQNAYECPVARWVRFLHSYTSQLLPSTLNVWNRRRSVMTWQTGLMIAQCGNT